MPKRLGINMFEELKELLQASTAPMVLISGTGIFLLTINARFIHAVERTWKVNKEMEESSDDEVLKEIIDILFKRCRLLRRSLELLVCSVISSGLLMVAIFIATLSGYEVKVIGISLLALSCLLIVASMIILLLDVILSSKATMLKIKK